MVFKYIKKRPRRGKNKSIINNSNKVIKGIELIKSMIDNDEFKIPGGYYAKPNYNINLDWMNDKDDMKRQLKKRIQFI